jgi:ATP-binding cassette subfamily G (WHITE) protein 2
MLSFRFLVPLALLLSLSSASSSTSTSSDVVDAACDSNYGQLDASTGYCECLDGFSGLGCRMCSVNDNDTSDVCSTALGSEYSCVSGFVYDANALAITYTCTLSSDLQLLFPDGALDVSCDRDEQGVANCSAAVYKAKETVNSAHVIDCELTQCSFATGSANGKCGDITCTCGSECGAMTKDLVEGALSGKSAEIQVADASDELSIVIASSPLPLSATCKASACERTGSSSSTSGSTTSVNTSTEDEDSSDTEGALLAVVACAALVALLLLGCCAFCCCFVGTRHGEQEDLDTELLKVSLRSAKSRVPQR